jgi:hypothetical protein
MRNILGYLSDRPMAMYGELAREETDRQLEEHAL